MVNANYMTGRKKYPGRPQGMLWADDFAVLDNDFLVPPGFEKYSDLSQVGDVTGNSFIILSDHNRQPIEFVNNRIEQRKRMANGMMRSYYVDDKISINASWQNLPSRSHFRRPNFNQNTGLSPYSNINNEEFTADGGAGGAEMLRWYYDHPGPFWVYLSYDRFTTFGTDDAAYQNLNKYSQIVQMYIAVFDYSVVKRGSTNYDMWDINVSLEEV
jgi:hypothetical protein